MFSRALDYLRGIDWRIFFGVTLTVIWLIAGVVYIRGSGFNYQSVSDVPLDDLEVSLRVPSHRWRSCGWLSVCLFSNGSWPTTPRFYANHLCSPKSRHRQ